MFYFWRTVALIALGSLFVYYWQKPFLLPLKIFVVYFHEISHAIAALSTGGEITAINVHWDESGFVTTKGGNLIITAGAGYIGSIFWGSIMLNASVRNQYIRFTSFIVALVLLGFTILAHKLNLGKNIEISGILLGYFWGFLFLFVPLLSRFLARLLLFLMGGLSVLYSVYDLLNDFLSSEIMKSDAGLIAQYLIGKKPEALFLAYFIAILIWLISITILIFFVANGIRREKEIKEASMDENQMIHPKNQN